ncbi:MAG: tetratricopeptide repeat protein [Lachnospiraceae bacterium]|nr:tetratricopeptide repeat protein [Lachnospiraceae bacterium]MDY3730673.1 tetratricopeptide repeat protein [Candidatus Choladocola sp.]
MDKYEYNLKLEEIDKLVDQGDYTEAANLADTIDWRRVRNVRTLCLISEIYEAAGRLEDSKTLLVRAYRRSPVGRTVLYRLVEVTTALQQYDEAIEYYTEYVQAAPHDNNRYILKYKIYKGRGSSIEELIAILEEYLGQEYTERWAYELATLYQQSGQMQKCLAACDDLVLWFHSGKYVVKALELKKRYAALTPKQQQIYEESIQEKMDDYLDEEEPEEETVIQPQPSAEIDGDVLAESIMAQTEKEIATQVAAHKAEMEKQAAGESAADAEASKEEPSSETQQKADEEAENGAPEDTQDIQVELAKSMRKIISGVVKRIDETEEDVPASVDASLQNPQKIVMPEAPEQVAGQLSIDDVLLSMSDQGKKVTDAVLQADEDEHPEKEEKAETPEESTADKPLDVQTIPVPERGKSVTEAATDELTKAQREALQYTNHPEKLLRNKKAVPTYTEEKPADEDDLGKTRRIVNTKEELMEAAKKEILAEKTIRIPTEEISRKIQEEPLRQETQDEAPEYDEAVSDVEEIDGAQEAEAEMYPEETYEENDSYGEDGYDDYEEEYLTIPSHLRNLFSGFTEIEGLEDQIANAIIQAESKGDDRTSRTGNILIFGAHGSGKTTLAMNIAKAIAQDKGSQVMKMAKIYATDLNRKDIAATVAKIAGGTLIIEEAGDLEPGTVEQLTTAMEFRTDGLIVILEDEQKYIHELLMRHPRFTMKFTAQIYIPEYTVEELAMFGQIYANAQDYVIGEEAQAVLCQKIADELAAGNQMAITEVIDIVGRAITRSNKFFRKMSMGKKRYDENDYIILFPKDFK